jgi:hypothetical protein
MINHVVYHYFQATDRGEVFQMPPELTEEEELTVVVLISKEEERRAELRAFSELANALVLSVVLPPPPGPPPMQPPRTPPARPHRGQGGTMGRLARSCTRVAGGRAACPGLGSRDADPHQGLHRRP